LVEIAEASAEMGIEAESAGIESGLDFVLLVEDELDHLEHGVLGLFAFKGGLKDKKGAQSDVGVVGDVAVEDGLEVFGFGKKLAEVGKAVVSVKIVEKRFGEFEIIRCVHGGHIAAFWGLMEAFFGVFADAFVHAEALVLLGVFVGEDVEKRFVAEGLDQIDGGRSVGERVELKDALGGFEGKAAPKDGALGEGVALCVAQEIP